MTIVTDLPLEVLSFILKFLPYSDIQSIRLVCHRFYSASLDFKILDKEIIIFDEEYYCFQPPSLLLSNRSFLHLRLQNYKTFSFDTKVWSHIGPELKSLSLVSCRLTENQLFAVLSNCNNLKYLEISTCSIETRSTCRDILRNISQPFRNLFSENSNFQDQPIFSKVRRKYLRHLFDTNTLKRYDTLKRINCGEDSACTPILVNLESVRVENRLNSRLLWKIMDNAPNLKSHAITGYQDQHSQRRKLSAKLGILKLNLKTEKQFKELKSD